MAHGKVVKVFYNVSKEKFEQEINIKVLSELDICSPLYFTHFAL